MSEEASDPAPAPASPAADVAPRGPNKKLWLVGAAALLSVLALGAGVTAWLWPAPVHARNRPVPAATAASAAEAAAHGESAAPPVAASAGASAQPATATSATPATSSAPLAERSEAASDDAAAQAASAGDDPMDRLRSRLDEKLGMHLQPTATPGELRLLMRPGAAAVVAAAGKLPHAPSWSYAGRDGPDAWGRLDARFSACAKGKRQSPIDIRDGIALDLDELKFDYRPSAFTVIDDGHTVQVNVAAGNHIELRGKRWQLRQLHFHRPAEERIDGKRFDMAVHLVHTDDQGRLAVVAVLLQRGAARPLLRAVWNDLPLEKGEEAKARATIDPSRLLPEERRYYTYMGSLTTPPCSEGVLWMVMRAPLTVAASDVDIFARLYPMNARPLQPSNGRLIKQSD